jgi:hypothetical protein
VLSSTNRVEDRSVELLRLLTFAVFLPVIVDDDFESDYFVVIFD